LTQTTICKNAASLIRILDDQTKEISGMCFVNSSMAKVQWRNADEFVESAANTNPIIAAYTTALARLKLYSYLDQLGKRVLYFDTDSCIYLTKPGEVELPTGDFLGDLTDELNGNYMGEFVSGGPKNYAYNVCDVEGNIISTCCKVKGVTLNARNCKFVNFASLKDLVIDFAQNKDVEDVEQRNVTVTDNRIMRTTKHTVVTREVSKIWRVVYDKRQLLENYKTRPWGHK